ncbi:MAG: SPFH domain-containing protein [Lachnospiraceae bacterium]|nr:SPFH domain-containing protein [Lachnospiraceae bacterium]
MGLFGTTVVEWKDTFNEETVFWKWNDSEIKKGSRLVLRPGQDAIFINNGQIEGIFTDDGTYDIESEIVPFLNTLNNFRFGFTQTLKVEIIFVNTTVMSAKWGTKNAILVSTENIPGGMPVRAFGTFSFKINDYLSLIENVAGIRKIYKVTDIRERVIANVDRLLMKWISRSGKDMLNLQGSAYDIGTGMLEDMNNELMDTGVMFVDFNIQGFSYPDDVEKYRNMEIGKKLGRVGVEHSDKNVKQVTAPKFCPECGTPTNGAKFCPECGHKLI